MKRKTFESWLKTTGYSKAHESSIKPLLVPMMNAFDANNPFIDHQAKRISELEDSIKEWVGLYNEKCRTVRELERQNALYKDDLFDTVRQVLYYSDYGFQIIRDMQEKYGIVDDFDGKLARETKRMIDGE